MVIVTLTAVDRAGAVVGVMTPGVVEVVPVMVNTGPGIWTQNTLYFCTTVALEKEHVTQNRFSLLLSMHLLRCMCCNRTIICGAVHVIDLYTG